MKTMKWLMSLVFVAGLALFLSSCALDVSAQDDTYVTLDINPSVELIVNPREVVVYANPLNEDGEVLLAEIDVIGLDLDEAVDLIIQTAIELGYIDIDAEETIVSVTAVANDPEIGERIRDRVKEHVNESFMNRGMKGRAEDKGFTPEFLAEAESYGVTPGFLRLAQSAVVVSDGLLLEDALLMSVDELQAILQTAREEMHDVAQALRDEFLAARQALYDEYFPQIEAIKVDLALAEANLVTLNEALTAKIAELEAATEGTEAIQAEIDQLEADILVLEANIQSYLDQIQALREELLAEVTIIRDQFHEESAAIRNQIRELVQARRQQHHDDVEDFMNHMQERHEERKDEIEEWQNRRP